MNAFDSKNGLNTSTKSKRQEAKKVHSMQTLRSWKDLQMCLNIYSNETNEFP